jgi:hypothetical protein
MNRVLHSRGQQRKRIFAFSNEEPTTINVSIWNFPMASHERAAEKSAVPYELKIDQLESQNSTKNIRMGY